MLLTSNQARILELVAECDGLRAENERQAHQIAEQDKSLAIAYQYRSEVDAENERLRTALDPSRSAEVARLFHDTYERLAPTFGYETREDTRQFDPTSPNGALMIAVVGSVLRDLARDKDGA